MPGPEECFESKQALNARFRESNRNISPIEKDYHTNLKECKNDILFIAYQVSSIVDNYMEYYNKEKYQWGLAKLSPDEFYEFYITGEYPLKIENPPPVPIPEKPAGELGRTKALKERENGDRKTAE